MLFIPGNPLKCDCYARPLLHFYQSLLNPPKSFKDIVCHSPNIFYNKPLYQVRDDNLNCPHIVEEMNSYLAIAPDLMFREIIL